MTRSAKTPSQRQLRVGEEIRHALARIIGSGRLHDPDLTGVSITVTEVRVSPDLRAATAFVTPFGGGDGQKIVSALRRAAGFLQRELSGEIELRVLPKLDFAQDTSFARAAVIERILSDPKVARDLDGRSGEAGGAGPEKSNGA
ncbi:MAG TPA: 30S ribosome-binding factor RbfA [Alphaproteobacteria bacterium]|nr:30S ribosome-binding factor RbfA [Alphaproteobacteria bacterium]